MNIIFRKLAVLSSIACIGAPAYAAITVGDVAEPMGELTIRGAIRAKYRYKDYANSEHESKLEYADARLVLDYDSPLLLGHFDYRCYQDDDYCDRSALVDAWLGYKIDDKQQLIVGVNPIPSGLSRFWGTTYYEGLLNTMGIEDVHYLGIKYQFKDDSNELQLGFYPTDSGSYTGSSTGSKRYSAAPVRAEDLSTGTDTSETNMMIGRVAHTIHFDMDTPVRTQLGGSFKHSTIANSRTGRDGSRQVWTVFADNYWDQWNLKLLAGQQDIDNKDDKFTDYTTFGSFDYPYQIANKGDFYSAELNYTWDKSFGKLTGIKPYINYSSYQKSKSGYQASTRAITGVAFAYEKWGIQAEYILSKNDAMIGGNSRSLAEGDSGEWNKLLYVSLGYYF